MTEQRLEEIWRDNLRKYNGNLRLDSIIIRAMYEACNEVESKFKNLTIPVVSVAKHPLPRPLEAWKAAREMDFGDYCEWHLEQERRGNAH